MSGNFCRGITDCLDKIIGKAMLPGYNAFRGTGFGQSYSEVRKFLPAGHAVDKKDEIIFFDAEGAQVPVKINILQQGAGIEFISSGIVTGAEIIEANRKIYTPEYLLPCKYKIIDRSACTEYRVSSEEIQVIAYQDIEASKINGNLTIVLISPTDVQYGMTRMWQMLSEETGFTSKIFKSREGAYEFIMENFTESGNAADLDRRPLD